MRTCALLLVASCAGHVAPEPSATAANITFVEYSKPIHVELRFASLYASLQPPSCPVRGESRPVLVAPIINAVVASAEVAAPAAWRKGYAVFVVDATKEWPDEALREPTYPLDVHPTIDRVIDRPTIAIDPRTTTGMLLVAVPGLGSTSYCLRVSDDGTRVTADAFLRSVSN